MVFEKTNIKIYRYLKGDIDRREAEFNITFHKIYRCAKGDIDRREAEVNITFQTSINLILGSPNTNYCSITFLCQAFGKGNMTHISYSFSPSLTNVAF